MSKWTRNSLTRITDANNVGEIQLQSHRDAKEPDARQQLSRAKANNQPPMSTLISGMYIDIFLYFTSINTYTACIQRQVISPSPSESSNPVVDDNGQAETTTVKGK
jgi:hypothetical protein